MNPLLEDLNERGFIHSCTDLKGLSDRMDAGPITVYAGFDPTADSLHVGSLMTLMLLRRFREAGHIVVPLVGGATGMVGDPTGKDALRPRLDRTQLFRNSEGVSHSIQCVLGEMMILNNADWVGGTTLMGFLDRVGSKIGVTKMLALESVKSRIDRELPITFQEFTYSLIQAFDFLELHERTGVCLQVGGSDQWGNITMGTELIRKTHGDVGVFGLTHPLLTTSDGRKMGKTETGAVWLNGPDSGFTNHTSDFDFWQFWRNIPDDRVESFLKLFTNVNHDEHVDLNAAKGLLATTMVGIIRGSEAAERSREAARVAFTDRGNSTEGLPEHIMEGPVSVIEMAIRCGFAQSKSAARRLIDQNGLSVNGEPVASPDTILEPQEGIRFSKGKKNHVAVRWTNPGKSDV